jgi:hypothetical protein
MAELTLSQEDINELLVVLNIALYDTTEMIRLSHDHGGVSISKREKCTLSKTGCRADLLMWLPKRIEEKGFEVRKVSPLARSSPVSILSWMLVWPYRPTYLLSVHFSRFDMLTPTWGSRTILAY